MTKNIYMVICFKISTHKNVMVVIPNIRPGYQDRSHNRMEFSGSITSRQHSILRFNCFICFSCNEIMLFEDKNERHCH